ncbi:MAG TPA: DUF4271 domain-containing protein [Bacteroidales bacterium]|nr:DUF4271 domain-containing protein [Bacteroidales bacterium]HPT01722.1 DUF4271 domain-containing protein [Bacteroidales bacterium]
MLTGIPRYKTNPLISDTTGFFNAYIPYTAEKHQTTNDSLLRYYYYPMPAVTPGRNDTISIHETSSVFAPHQLQPIHKNPLANKPLSADWITGVFMLCLIILAVVKASLPRRLQQIFRSAAQLYYVNQLEREGNLLKESISFALGFLYLTSVSFLLYKLSILFSPGILAGIKSFFLFSAIFLGCLLYYMLKTVLVSSVGTIFKTPKATHDYLINNLIFSIVTGILLFPATILALYINNPIYVWIACSIFSILLVYKFIRTFMIGLANTKYSMFYLFLYLCTIEILPFLLLFKTVQQF